MDYAIVCIEEKKLSNRLIAPINQVWLFKKMKLPCELFGFDGNQVTKEAKEPRLKSCILWKERFDEVPIPSKKLIEI